MRWDVGYGLRSLLVAAACAIAVGGLTGSASAISNLPQISSSVVVDGSVTAIAFSGSTIVLGGTFNHAGAYTGGFASAPVSGGTPTTLPAIAGTVNAVVSDGSGGWYVGGSFATVGTATLANLAHITSGGVADAAWNPSPDAQVNTLALSSDGKTLFVGGAFATIGGSSRNNVAALTASTGATTSWNPNANAAVSDLVLSPDGATLYAAGSFTSIGGQSRAGLAALGVSSGAATSWNPAPDNTVSAIAVSPSGSTVYAGGSFANVGGASRSNLAAVSSSGTGTATSWTPQANGAVTALAVSSDGNTVYPGGTFTSVGGQSRIDLGAVSASTGNATSWDPSPNNSVTALVLSGSTIYAGGTFTTIGGQSRQNLAAVSTSDGTATTWQEDTDGQVSAIAVTSSAVGVGGTLTGVGLQARGGLAAVSTSGQLLSLNPSPNGAVNALAFSSDGATLYVGGAFTSLGGQTRNRIAAITLSSGLVTSWNPNASSTVLALAAAENGTVYAGGLFTTIGGSTRNRIAALDTSGSATAWDPNATSGQVNALALATSSGSVTVVYAGGTFTTIGGSARNRIAALDPSTGNATSWNPNATSLAVSAIALSSAQTTVYVGGTFVNVGGQARNRIAALDSSTGNATSWNPNATTGAVNALAVSADDSTVYLGGTFTIVGGQTRNRVAAIDSSGSATTWNPNISVTSVNALASTAGGLAVGGLWTTIGSTRLSNYAVFAFDVPAATVNPSISGTATVGSTLTCATGTWTNAPSSYAYQWQRDGSSIGGATATTYALVSADLGHKVACKVTATAAEGSGTATSATVLVVAVPQNSVAPVVLGTAGVGSLLTCNAGTWTYSPSFAYVWLRGGSAISGAGSTTYTVTSADGGGALACRVTGSNAAGSSIATSAAVLIPVVSSGGTGGGGTTPPPPTPGAPQTVAISPGVAGSIALPAVATVAWGAGTFTAPGSFAVSRLSLAADVDGFSRSSRAVSVSFAPGGVSTPAVAFLPSPLAITFVAPTPQAAIPSYSIKGAAWTPLAALTRDELGAGTLDGYYRRPNGAIVVYTRRTGNFALLEDIEPPTRPGTIIASLVHTTLRLAWPPSADNSRRIRSYQILRGTKVVRTVSGGHTSGSVNLRSLTKSGSYSIRAVDYAGNVGPRSRAVTIVVKRRPKGVPARIPAWAQQLQLWSATPKSVRGRRPVTPKVVPSWYRPWSRWVATRFTLRP